MVKKLLWTGLVTGISATSMALAFRLAERIWRRVNHEAPPPLPKWARFAVAKPLKKGILGRMHAPAV